MKNLLIGFITAVLMISLMSSKTMNDFLTMKPETPDQVAMVIDDNLFDARTKAFEYIERGFVIKQIESFNSGRNPYYKVVIILERY